MKLASFNKLWVRLSLAFGGVILLAALIVIITGIFLGRADRPENFREEFLKIPRGLVDELAMYYQQHHDWEGVEVLIQGAQSTFRVERGGGLTFFLADADKRVIYHIQPEEIGKSLREVEQLRILPIRLRDRRVGYLGVSETPLGLEIEHDHSNNNPPAPPPPSVADQIRNVLLMIAALGGSIGIVFGILISRTLTAPLNRLAEAAKAIGARDLTRRVEIKKGSTEMRALAQSFNDMAADLEQAEQLRRNLLADVAHELRTPLSVLQGNLRAILDEVYPLEVSEMARLYEQTRLLSRLVNDLHELAQAEARQLPLNLQKIDLKPLVETTSETFLPSAEAKGIDLHLEMPDMLPSIYVDRARLAQVLQNLLANALRHTSPGGTITLEAESDTDTDTLCLEITDTGEGIPPEHQPYIFERFYRTDPARSRDRGGAGLGLAIARAIIEAHDGRIEAESSGVPGEGTTFRLYLPCYLADESE